MQELTRKYIIFKYGDLNVNKIKITALLLTLSLCTQGSTNIYANEIKNCDDIPVGIHVAPMTKPRPNCYKVKDDTKLDLNYIKNTIPTIDSNFNLKQRILFRNKKILHLSSNISNGEVPLLVTVNLLYTSDTNIQAGLITTPLKPKTKVSLNLYCQDKWQFSSESNIYTCGKNKQISMYAYGA